MAIITMHNMRLMQAAQFIFYSRKCCKFGLRLLLLAVIKSGMTALISKSM